jgi:hypothetical protein
MILLEKSDILSFAAENAIARKRRQSLASRESQEGQGTIKRSIGGLYISIIHKRPTDICLSTNIAGRVMSATRYASSSRR